MTLDSSWVAAADPRRRVGRAVEFHPVIGSTNDRARELLALPDGAGDGVVVVADLQTAGRGRHGRVWLSPVGTNLMVSVAVRPMLTAGDAWRIGAAAALAGAAACDEWASPAVKWPNDLVAADGRKMGGILIETALDGDRLASAVIGLGINANWSSDSMPPEISSTACSLAELAGSPVDRIALLSRYLDALDAELAAIGRGESPIQRLRARSWLDGRWIRVETGSGGVEGRALGLGDEGELLVDSPAGAVGLRIGEVVQVRAAGEVAA